MREIILKKKNEIISSESDAEELTASFVQVDLTVLDKAKANGIIGEIVQSAQVVRNMAAVVSPESVYVLNIPKDIKKGLDSGEYWFTKKVDTGEMLTSVSREKDGRKQFFKNLTADERSLVDESALQNLSDGIYNIAIQQQMAAIAEELENIHEAVGRIESGQKDDRFGEITGAEYNLRLALSASDRDRQISLTTAAIQTLSIGAGKIEKTLSRKVGDFEPIPEKDRSIYWKMIKSPQNYKDKKDREFDEVQDYFDFYEKAQQLLAVASLMIDEPEAMLEVFKSFEEYLGSLDLTNLKTIRNLYPELDLSEEWFERPRLHVASIKELYLEFADKQYDYISFEVSGAQLLEAVNDDKDEESEE